jgi:hypothetical protein
MNMRFVFRVIGEYYRTRPERSGPAAMVTCLIKLKIDKGKNLVL